jgi:hypothetical protein
MKKNKEKIKIFTEIELPIELRGKILAKIDKVREKKAFRKMIVFRAVTFFGLFASCWSFFIFLPKLFISDFWNITRLLVTDFREVLVYWQDYGFSLLENFPAVEIFAILAPVVLTLIFLNYYYENLKSLRTVSHN